MWRVLSVGVSMSLVCLAVHAAEAGPIAIENDYARYEFSSGGTVLQLTDKATGTGYAKPDAPLAEVKLGGQMVPVSGLTYEGGRLVMHFAGPAEASVTLGVNVQPHYVVVEVLEATPGIEELAFVNVPTTLAGTLQDPFTCCALALNLQTNVAEVPGPMKGLRALCYPRFGMQGAKVALLACPQAELRNVMKEAITAAVDAGDEIPRTNIGGPWALDGEVNRGSYIFDFGYITEETVDKWIAFAKEVGITQIDFHTGESLRFGDCLPNPKLFPNGRASVKAVLDKLHAAGMSAGLHTYAFFLAKNTPYVTPVPDPRLGKMATFTLAEAIAADTPEAPVTESTANVSTITGFFVHNSVTLQIDDELITFTGATKEAPFTFTGCTRGALGTKAAAHATGAKVYQLKECFGLFTPDADSTLLAEIAANQADTYNECGFDMMYLDALDGEAILGGAENAWHYGSKYVFEIAKRLNKPALFEMSTFHHHLWYVRGRMGAWDHPTRWHKRFIDIHSAANNEAAGMFLPMNLGWWAVKSGGDIQVEPTFPDDIEYLMGKCLANDNSISLMGMTPETLATVPFHQRLAPIFRQYEELRLSRYFPESIRARLRAPGEEFTLEQTDGKWRFRPVRYERHKVQGMDGWSNQWTTENRFDAQPLAMRIEALMAVTPYDSPEAMVLEDFAKPDAFTTHENQTGATSELANATENVKSGNLSGLFTASSDRPEPDGAWTKIGRTFAPPLNIAQKQGLGVWVHGDGQGELLNVQLRSPLHTTSLGYGDHYVKVDFTGWRYFELVEPEGGHIDDFAWPYRGHAYAIYRENVDYNQVETVSLWYNLLPQGAKVACHLSPIKALPLTKAKLVNPKITLGGQTIVFPVEIESASYLEFRAMDDCKLYGSDGALLAEVKPEGSVPQLAPGANPIEIECATDSGANPRAYVTVITKGVALE
ncbi:MAG: hypothetical protein IT365_22200 [Candidatus Hydrogenedentes bacterium]|nr:hypothetical protein [Candidatus Hydrogenedentota bacterium]